MNQKQMVLLSIGVILLMIVGISLAIRSRNDRQETATLSPTPSTDVTTSPTPEDQPNNDSDNGSSTPATPSRTSRPTVAPPTPSTREANIKVFTPTANTRVDSSFSTTGEARVFENTFQVRVSKSVTGEVLFNTNAQANSPDTGQFGPFQVPIILSSDNLSAGDRLTLEVFQYSAKDGTEIDKVAVPLIYSE